MNRIAAGVAGMCTGLAAVAVAAGGPAAAELPAGVYCLQSLCYNSTPETQNVTGTVVCSWIDMPVTWSIPPTSAASLDAGCPDGKHSEGIRI
ncbi:hypothetical protein BJY24_005998 [Nocardia transvalensis]|uniref:Secreted protein n=1 Tax=Nocardia transvalensis TaxID=37333 RepID=A0A7W9UL23_9NOCA|nr:hypothetical protein [Nocardia transvalensis]MBB5917086.1 hypothetical protein [Nocardia transvalensis]